MDIRKFFGGPPAAKKTAPVATDTKSKQKSSSDDVIIVASKSNPSSKDKTEKCDNRKVVDRKSEAQAAKDNKEKKVNSKDLKVKGHNAETGQADSSLKKHHVSKSSDEKSAPQKSSNGNSKNASIKHSEKTKKKIRTISSDSESNDAVVIDDYDEDDFEREESVKKSSTSRNRRYSKESHKSVTGKTDNNDEKSRRNKRKSSDDSVAGKRKRKQSSGGPAELIADEDDEDDDKIQPKSRSKTVRGKKSRKSHIIYDSDSAEEDPVPKSIKKKRTKKAAIHIVDSDDEAAEKKRSPIKSFFTPTSKPAEIKSTRSSSSNTSQLKPVSVADFFGSSSVHRSERMTVVKRKASDDSRKTSHDDDEIHDDDDFVKTLDQLDDKQVHKKPKIESPKKLSPLTGSLSSKLASRARTAASDDNNNSQHTPAKSNSPDLDRLECVFVPDTPLSYKSPVKKTLMKHSPLKAEVSPHKLDVPAKKVSPTKITVSPAKVAVRPLKTEVIAVKKPSPAKVSMSPSADTTQQTPKTGGGAGYRSYLRREGPQALGSKEIPQGAENCLEGMTFVITGVLDSIDREEAKSLLERYGGKVTTTISKKTDYVVMGRDAGQSKMEKARQCGTKQIDEDAMLELIRTRPGKKSKYQIQAEMDAKNDKEKAPSSVDKLKTFSRSPDHSRSNQSASKSTHFTSNQTSQSSQRSFMGSQSSQQSFSASQSDSQASSHVSGSEESEGVLLWVDKYKPTSMKRIIGQQGDKSNANKLYQWLVSWHKNRALGKKPQGGFWGKDDGSGHKATLLSGPPGVGKTTTATLVCQEAKFSYVELNASDTRSKKTLQNVVSESLDNQTLVDYFGAVKKLKAADQGHMHCLIMDEVDGVAGNEDRGGIAELIQLIKDSKIPIICICNDRNAQKMRSLVNHCFDLRFQRPRLEQIKGAMMSLIYKEGLSIPPPAMNEIILGANQDIRQVIHNLSMWSAGDKAMTYDQAKADAQKAKKDMKMGPFDVCRKVFVGGDETAHMSLMDKSDLFFQDYSIGPLFVQENYIHVTPYAARGNVTRHLSQLARTADSLCDADVCEKHLRSQNSWGLLPTVAMYASVIPGEYMRGSLSTMVNFPSWLGKNSSRNKHDRILQELNTHMSLKISSYKQSLNLDYLPFLRTTLTNPLVQRDADGVKEVIGLMDEYDIIKDDFDNIMEVTKWPNSSDPMSVLSSKTKAAFTRSYNKESHATPYVISADVKKRGRGQSVAASNDELLGEESQAAIANSDTEDEDDIKNNPMIKKKTKAAPQSKKNTTGVKNPAGGQKSRGRGRGKGKTK